MLWNQLAVFQSGVSFSNPLEEILGFKIQISKQFFNYSEIFLRFIWFTVKGNFIFDGPPRNMAIWLYGSRRE